MLEVVEYSQHYFVSITFQHIVLDSCICTYASERYFHMRSDKSRMAPVQTAVEPVKKTTLKSSVKNFTH